MEMSLVGPARQHEEAWFLGLRSNPGVDVAALRRNLAKSWLHPRWKQSSGSSTMN